MQFLKGHSEHIRTLCFSPDGSHLVSVDEDSRLVLWGFPEGKQLGQCSHYLGAYDDCRFSPDCRFFALPHRAGDDRVRIYSVSDLSEFDVPVTRSNNRQEVTGVDSLRYSEDGANLDLILRRITDWGRPTARHFLVHCRWDVEHKKLDELSSEELRAEAELGNLWELDPARSLVAIAVKGKVVFWNVEKRGIECEVILHRKAVCDCLVFGPEGQRLACTTTNSIHILDVPNRKLLVSYKNPTPKHIQALAFSPDGQTLTTVSNDTFVRMWETDTGREVKAYAWEFGQLKSVAIAPDGMRAAAAGKRGKIVVWDLD